MVLHAKAVNKTFKSQSGKIQVLNDINFEISAHQKIAIVGTSGSGKSTLLQILAGLEKPDSGSVYLFEHALHSTRSKVLNRLRNRHLGFIYQFHHLLPEFTVLENICMPLFLQGKNWKEATSEANILMNKMGLAYRADHKPFQISGGERQRTAIARAAITKPACILADEPTGNLDRKTASDVLNILFELEQTSLILVTHDDAVAKRMDSIFQLENGSLVPAFTKKENETV